MTLPLAAAGLLLPWWSVLASALAAGLAVFLAYLAQKTQTKRHESELRLVARSARCFLWHSTVTDRDGEFAWNLRIYTEEMDAFLTVDELPATSKARTWYFGRRQDELVRLGDNARAAMRAGRPGYTQEFPCNDAAGQEVWFAEDVTIEKISENQWHLVGVSTDITDRKKAEAEVKKLSGLLPICSSCKKVRDDAGYWRQIEVYIHSRAAVQFSHGLCPDCKARLYPGLQDM